MRRRIFYGRFTVIFFSPLLLCMNAWTQDQSASARSSIQPDGDIWTGQKVGWVVELIVPGFFSGAPSYDLPDVPGLLILPPDGTPVVGSEQNGGVDETVQRLEFSAFAHRSGTFQIPPMSVRLAFKRQPLDPQAVSQIVQTPAVSFIAQSPPGAENSGSVLSSRDLSVEEEWNPQPGRAKAGDAFVRTITFSATDIPGMAFPPFRESEIPGLGIYPKTPEVQDQSDRGNLRGLRRESITYVCQNPGRYTIPSYQLVWWNLETRKLETTVLPGQSIEVSGLSTDSGKNDLIRGVIAAFLGIVFFGLLLFKLRKVPLGSLLRKIFFPWRTVHLSPLNPGPKN